MGWIEFKNQKPQEGEYLVSDGENVTCAYYDYYGDWCAPLDVSPTYEMSGISLDITVTHWAHKPEPPKAK